MKITDSETLTRIVESAENLFSTKGYHDTSIRDVIAKAKVNLAGVHYHFGNKELLYCEVLRRRLRSLNRSRLEKLQNAVALAGDEPIPLTLIIDIFARPFFEPGGGLAGKNNHASRLIGRSIAEPLPFAEGLLASELHPTTAHFARAIRKHVPSLTPTEFMWRLNFVVGAMHHALATIHQMTALTRGICHNNDFESALSHFVEFATTAFRPQTRHPLGHGNRV